MRLGFASLVLGIALQALAATTLFAQTSSPRATIETSLGNLVIELDSEHTPATVANFVRYAREGHFDGTIFYRVVPGFVIQAGSVDAEGKQRSVHDAIPLETANAASNARGTIAMARADEPNSAVAEFFINLGDNSGLDHQPDDHDNKTGYAVFGHVVEGMDVLDRIAAVPLMGGVGPFPDAAPAMPVTIVKVTVQ
jgi:cyclophilin family peptidyl-prolyl cis-trans isomerase